MRTKIPIFTASFAMLVCLSNLNRQLSAAPLGTAFTYQGRLADASNPANGVFDFKFAIPPMALASWAPSRTAPCL
jgi:hypothetical protein